MAELKRTFTGGKMEKDLDERIVPNGQYREALNIGVSTSEDSDVGAAQNILGNIKVTSVIQARSLNANGDPNDEYAGQNFHVAEVVDPQTDMLYRFIHTVAPSKSGEVGIIDGVSYQGIWMDRIIEYNTTKSLDNHWYDKERAVMIDIFKVEDKIAEIDTICESSNKTKIKIHHNINQLRWGMRAEGRPAPNENVFSSGDCFADPVDCVTIEDIDYQSGVITLSKPIYVMDPQAGVNQMITFYGDRNLSFGSTPSGDGKGLKNITGINIIDGMIFWTDNYSEPKKIHIERSKAGCDSSHWAELGRGTSQIDDFNQHTLLVVNDENPEDCMEDDTICPVLGCMDPIACNYNHLAIVDDGSCGYFGCTDATPGVNPDINGNCRTGTLYGATGNCDNPPWVIGNGYAVFNFDPLAACDDGTCCYIAGCTDPTACNYTADACIDDGSCRGLLGCMDQNANNYDPLATCNGGCLYDYDCFWGYAEDLCLPGDGVYPGGVTTDIWDTTNWFSAPSADMRPTSNVLAEFFDSGSSIQSIVWETNWYLSHYNTPGSVIGNIGLPQGQASNGKCDWQLMDNSPVIPLNAPLTSANTTILNKEKINVLKVSNTFWTVDESLNPLPPNTGPTALALNNATGVNQGSTSAMTSIYWQPNQLETYTQTTNTWANVIDFLQNYSVFNGNFNALDSAGVQIAIPAVNLGMTYQQVYDIVTAEYDFGDGINGDMMLTWTSNNCQCDVYYEVPTCIQLLGGPYDSISDCQNCASCDCNTMVTTYNCVNGACVSVPNAGGTYSDFLACQSSGCITTVNSN